jgi:hypothetical protein
MSVAPYTINGGSAEQGGVASVFGSSASAESADEDDEIAAALASVGATITPTDPCLLMSGPDPFMMLRDSGTGAMAPPRFTPTSSSCASSSASPAASSSSASPVETGGAVAPITTITTIGKAPVTRRRGRDLNGELPAPSDPVMLMMMQMMKNQSEQAAAASKRQDDLMLFLLKSIEDKEK